MAAHLVGQRNFLALGGSPAIRESLFFAQVRTPRALRFQPSNSSASGGCIGGESLHSHQTSGRSSIREEFHNEKGFLMLSPFRFAVILTVIFAVCGPARAEEIAPAGSGVTIDKVDIQNGLAHTVKYFVKGGSPRLQALVRRVEWAENELSVVEQLQQLKLDTVVNERRVAAFRTTQLTNPVYPHGFLPLSSATGYGGDGGSSLQRALNWQLADEATPDAALQLIGFLEDMQTQLDAELKALPPEEQKAAQGPIDALRPRVAALSSGNVLPAGPQPVVPQQVSFPAPAVPQPQPLPQSPVAFQQRVPQNQAEVEWHGTWYAAEVMQTNGDRYFIHYTGFANSWDEWVGPDRIRTPLARQ